MGKVVSHAIQFALIASGICVFGTSIGVLTVSIMAIKEGYDLWDLLKYDDAHDTKIIVYSSAGFLLSVCAGLSICLAPISCCGPVTRSRCLMGLYLTVAVCLLTSLTTGAALAFGQEVNEEYLSDPLLATLEKYDESSILQESKEVVGLWTKIMDENNCCGVENFTDWNGVSNYGPDHPEGYKVPEICCTNVKQLDESQELISECRKAPETMVAAFNELDGCTDEFVYEVKLNQDRVFYTSLSLMISFALNILAGIGLMCTMD